MAYFGNVKPSVEVSKLDDKKFKVEVSASSDIENVNIKTEDGIAKFTWVDDTKTSEENEPTHRKSFSMQANKEYSFFVTGEEESY